MEWYNFKRQKLNASIINVLNDVLISEHLDSNKLRLCIGSDSQVKGNIIEFGTVVVVLKERSGGIIFYTKEQSNSYISLKERMLTEVALAVQVANELMPIAQSYNISLEVHIDINKEPIHKSNIAYNDAVGYINGMGFVCKAKPEAFASSCCANRIVQ